MKQKEIKRILYQLSNELISKSKASINSIIWFGSTARGDSEIDSDIDVAVIGENDHRKTRDISYTISAELSLKYDCLITVFYISKQRLDEMEEVNRLLARNLKKDGIILWKRTV